MLGFAGLPGPFRGSGGVVVYPELLTTNQQGLETDTTGWAASSNCAISRTTVQKRTGAAALQLSATAASGSGMQASTPSGTSGFAVTDAGTYTATCYTRTAATAQQCRIGFDWYSAAGANLGFTSGTLVLNSTTGWTQLTVSGQPPAGSAFGRVYVKVGITSAASEIHYFDDFTARRTA